MKNKAYIFVILFLVIVLVVCIRFCSNISTFNPSGTVPYTVQTYEVKTVFNGIIDLIHTDIYANSTKEEKINMIDDYLRTINDHQDKNVKFVTKVVPDSIRVNKDSICYGEDTIYVVFKVSDHQTEYYWYHNKDEYDSKQEPYNYSVVK